MSGRCATTGDGTVQIAVAFAEPTASPPAAARQAATIVPGLLLCAATRHDLSETRQRTTPPALNNSQHTNKATMESTQPRRDNKLPQNAGVAGVELETCDGTLIEAGHTKPP
jgi:hypothetical protein